MAILLMFIVVGLVLYIALKDGENHDLKIRAQDAENSLALRKEFGFDDDVIEYDDACSLEASCRCVDCMPD